MRASVGRRRRGDVAGPACRRSWGTTTTTAIYDPPRSWDNRCPPREPRGGLRKPHVHGSVYHGSFGRLGPEALRARAAVARAPVVRLAVVEHLDLGGVPRRDRREEPGAGDRSVGSGPAVEHDQGVRTARARPQELLACDAVAPSPFLLRGFWAMSFKLMAQKPQSRRGEG